ncbi:transposase [Peribacillus sp. SCS-155]|uniref:transposase n=1 Tax=Peribacillus sedimenti TaxID=3115297 RepID=UPI003905EFCB
MYYHHYKEEKRDEEGTARRGRPFPSFSETLSGHRISDEEIEEFLMEAVEGEEGIYGYKKLTHHLKVRYGLKINKKKVMRLCRKLGILLPVRHAPSPYPRRLARQHVINGPNELWQVDIKYGSIEESGRFFFLASAIDVYDRSIVGHYRGSSCRAEDITEMLKEALKSRKVAIPKKEDEYSIIIRSDNGPQFLSKHFGEFCMEQKVYHERIPPKIAQPECLYRILSQYY